MNSQVYAVSLSNNIRDIQEDIFGLNGTNTIVAGSSWGELQNIQPHPFCKLQLGNIRYPGGQVSNWWNLKRGWFLNPLEYPAGITYHPAYDNTNPFNLDNGLDAFKANSDMLNANPIWSVNTLTSNKEYQTAFMFAARAKGFTVKNIELGVEYYLEYDNYKEKYPSPITYIKDMYDWTGYLKNLNVNSIHPFGNTKLAIVGSNSNSKDPGRRREWLNCILDDMQANPSLAQNIDAITIHDYFGAGSIHFNGLSNLMSPDDAKCMINQAYTTTQDLYDNEFLDIANKTGKEIWMTEYNLYDRTVYSVHATWAHGLTIALKSLRYLEQPLVTKLCMHTMTGDGGWASFLVMPMG
ncbi:MAG: hypothetical protein IPP29_03185 [Bacteroidetes bacterium]|nr:hypothetical protein [Bacteroidota bacterium]